MSHAQLRVNDVFTATVRDLASDGQGIVAHESGRIFFVPGVWSGEVARFRVTGLKNRLGYARLEQVLEPAPERRAPPCPYQGFAAGRCGGCAWQFVTYSAQLQAKQRRLASGLARLGLDSVIRPIWPSPAEFGYRNRAQLKTDGKLMGYVEPGGNRIAAIGDCLVLTEKNRATLGQLLGSMPDRTLRPSKGCQWTSIDIDEDVTAETISVNRRRPFRQANSQQNQRMKNWLATSLAPLVETLGDVSVLELFCGSGNFTETIIGAGCCNVLAVEAVDEALDALALKGLPGVRSQAANLFAAGAVQALARDNPDTAILILDPPRQGFANLDLLLAGLSRVKQVFYISCDLATFARDVETLLKRGLRAREIQPLDLFPQTPHVEILAHFAS